MNPKHILALIFFTLTIGDQPLIGEAKLEEPHNNKLVKNLRVLSSKNQDLQVKDTSKLKPDGALEIMSEALILTMSPEIQSMVKYLPVAIDIFSSVLSSNYTPLIDLASDYVFDPVVFRVDNMGAKLGDFLDNLGVEEEIYRQQSICYFGKSLRLAIPFYFEQWVNFLPESSLTKLKKNKSIHTFLMGFKERDCSSLSNYCEARNVKNPNTQ